MSIKSLSILAASALALSAGSAQAVDLVWTDIAMNGGFETGDKTGWTFEFGTFEGSTGSITVGSPGFSGDYAMTIDTGLPGFGLGVGIKNANIGGVVANEAIRISFMAKGSYDVGGVAFAELFSELSGGGVSKSELLGGSPLAAQKDMSDWASFSYTTTLGANVGGGVTLQLLSATGGAVGSMATTMFDDVRIEVLRPIPEPGTYALMLAGLAAVGGIARRRRQA
jgi:hypothetical protein